MTKEFKKLIALEKNKRITVGINRHHANNFWYRTTSTGKISNWLTIIFALLVIIIFVKIGIVVGIISIIGLVIYVKALNYISAIFVRIQLFKDEELFNAAYDARSLTIRDNKHNHSVIFPSDWYAVIDAII